MSIYKEKKILITGASAGIGYALSEELTKRGAEVIVTARRQDRLEELAKKIERAGGKVHIFNEDLSFCLLYTSPSPRDATLSRMPSSA